LLKLGLLSNICNIFIEPILYLTISERNNFEKRISIISASGCVAS
jgi:hypothetical protein